MKSMKSMKSMKIRLVRLYAGFSLLAVVALLTGNAILATLDNSPASLPSTLFETVVLLVFVLVGVLISARRPDNTIGTVFCVSALAWSLSGFTLEYAIHGLIIRPGTLPAANLMGVIGTATQSLGFDLIFTYLLLLFPTGHLPSPRWRPFSIIVAGLLAALMLDILFGHIANETELSPVLKNPIQLIDSTVSDNISSLLQLFVFIAAIICGVSLILRARRASGVERQQIKWLGYSAVLCILFIVFLVIVIFTLNGNISGDFFYVPPLAIAAATGISILRYRLFDIDVIINRTLVYGLLTVILAAVYFGGVIGAQTLINAFTRQGHIGPQGKQSPVLIVITTLLVAALFQPLRNRLQQFIDRRFYRSRYDARKTLDRFGASLRNEVELTHLTNHLLETVEQTMRPAHASLWLRPERPANSGQ
jgi:hypothetical protein